MKVKTSELTGRGLNAAVAVALGAKIVKTPESQSWMFHWPPGMMHSVDPRWTPWVPDYCDGDDRASVQKAMKVLERERMVINPIGGWHALGANMPASKTSYGPTSIIAIWRCFVTSKLGDEVEIPKELL